MQPLCLLPNRGRVVRFRGLATLALISAGLAVALVRPVAAQLTTEALIGDSVSDIGGTKYADVDEAIKRYTNRDILGAQQFLEAAVRKTPSLPPVDLLLAKMHFFAGDAAAGLMSLEKTAMDNPTDPEPYLILGDQAITQRQTIPADALYEKAIKLLDSFEGNNKRKRSLTIRARNGDSIVAEGRKDWPTAVDDLNALIKLDPENATAHYRLGRALFMQKKTKEGYDSFVKASQLDKNLPDPNVSAALIYEMMGSHNEAKTAFETAVKAKRNDAKTLASYAQWLLQTGDVGQAEKALKAARDVEPENLDVLVLSGVAARMEKKMQPAEDYLVAALRLAPSNAAVINQLALLLIDQPDEGKRKRAVEFAKINATMQQNNPEANVTYAWVLYQTGNNRDASAILRKVQFGGLSADSNYLVARMLADQNQTDFAKQVLESAFENSSGGVFVFKDDANELKTKLASP